MKKTKLFFTLFLIAFTIISCSNDESQSENEEVNATDLANTHNQIKQKFDDFYLSTVIQQKSSNSKQEQNEIEEYVDKVFDANYKYTLENGLEGLFSEYGLNPELINVVEWAMENINDEDLYSKLSSEFTITNQQDVNLIFYYIEIYKKFESNKLSLKGKFSKYSKVSSGCGRAVVGTILVTAVFIGVTAATGGFGGAGAAGFLVSKGWSIYNVIAACSDRAVLQERAPVPFLDEEAITIKDLNEIDIVLPTL
ncbi:hypothetical protein GCM10023314_05620 [Algibacter agarivorans]|uniref:Lipoprotein n=1 Tax=Algibacter agarivorans TaxID=1109741 RepID=A0ABP9GBZ8_9FLAO